MEIRFSVMAIFILIFKERWFQKVYNALNKSPALAELETTDISG